MAAAGAGGGAAAGAAAYIIMGHSSLESAKAEKVIPAGYTIITKGKCGYSTFANEQSKLFTNSEFTLALSNPESEIGINFLAKQFGPVLLEKEGDKYIETFLSPFAFYHSKEPILITTSGIIEAPFASYKYKSALVKREQLLSEIDIPQYFNYSIYPTKLQVVDAIGKAILFDAVDKGKELIKSDEDRKAITLSELRELWDFTKGNDYDNIMNLYTLGEFIDKNLATFNKLIGITLSKLLSILPQPGIIYSLSCRIVPAKNRRSYMQYNENAENAPENAGIRQNIIRRQIEEAELSRKRFVRAKVYPGPVLNDSINFKAALSTINFKLEQLHLQKEKAVTAKQRSTLRQKITELERARSELLATQTKGGRRTRRKPSKRKHTRKVLH